MQTVAIPRGQVALAAGHAAADADTFIVASTRGQTDDGICTTAFLEQAFRTDSFRITISFQPDGGWSHVTDTELMVHGRDMAFAHQDRNTLARVGPAKPNPLMIILQNRKAASPKG